MTSNFSKGADHLINAFIKRVENMNTNQIDQINKDQYRDELNHKIEVYDNVKATLKLCATMIKALDPTSENETYARKTLLNSLELARQSALMSAVDVETEKRGLGK